MTSARGRERKGRESRMVPSSKAWRVHTHACDASGATERYAMAEKYVSLQYDIQ